MRSLILPLFLLVFTRPVQPLSIPITQLSDAVYLRFPDLLPRHLIDSTLSAADEFHNKGSMTSDELTYTLQFGQKEGEIAKEASCIMQ